MGTCTQAWACCPSQQQPSQQQQHLESVESPLQAKFVERAQALLHGDMHTGSLMVTQDTTYAIDAEFAFYGPIAFDVGKFIANLLLAFFALDGHSTEAEPRTEQRAWLIQVQSSSHVKIPFALRQGLL